MELDYVAGRLLVGDEPIYPKLRFGPLLDGSPQSDLKWQIDQVPLEPFVWQLDLVSFSDLHDDALFTARALSVAHFAEQIFPNFPNGYGVVLYQGGLALEERDAVVEYLELLAMRLPSECPAFVLLHLEGELSERWGIAAPDRWERLVLATRGLERDRGAIWSDQGIEFFEKEVCAAALYLPACKEPLDPTVWNKAFGQIEAKEGEYRVIAEPHLHLEWSGLDRLYLVENELSMQAKRQVDGFVAAGGEVITL